MLKKFSKDGSQLFNSAIKNNRNVYRKELDNYRTYILDKIVNVYEIRFEQDVLERLFGTKTTASDKRNIIRDEVTDIDEENNQTII